jgi:hypothetical protein
MESGDSAAVMTALIESFESLLETSLRMNQKHSSTERHQFSPFVLHEGNKWQICSQSKRPARGGKLSYATGIRDFSRGP